MHFKAQHDKWFEDDELNVPKLPPIFKTNRYLLKNKNTVLVIISFILVIPIYISIIDVHLDGPTFVDLDITRFRLRKRNISSLEKSEDVYGIFRESEQNKGLYAWIADRKGSVKNITFGMVSCGFETLSSAVVSIKSVVASGLNYGVLNVKCHVFVETLDEADELSEALSEIKSDISWSSTFMFTYEIHLAEKFFPEKHHALWTHLYKKCSALHLFLPSALPQTKEILFLDTDSLILGDIRELWTFFDGMDKRQFAALALEQGTDGGFKSVYQAHSRIPFVPPAGVSAGVMLLNLTRMRQYDWQDRVTNALESFAQDLLFGSQDIFNILFYFNREYLTIIPCIYNFRRVNCKLVQHCETALSHPDGIQVLHGNTGSFLVDGDFRKIYEQFQKFDLFSGNFRRDVVLPIKWHYKNYELSNRVFPSGCVVIGRRIFKSWMDQEAFFKQNKTNVRPRRQAYKIPRGRLEL